MMSMSMMLVKTVLMSQAAFGYDPWATPLVSSYAVPVRQELREFAQFDMAGSWASFGEESTAIHYCLPRDIVGDREVAIDLKAGPVADSAFFTVAEAGRTGAFGHCIKAGASLTCMLQYPGLAFDVEANAAYLTRKYEGDANLPKRLEVMRAFSGDAIGILSLDL